MQPSVRYWNLRSRQYWGLLCSRRSVHVFGWFTRMGAIDLLYTLPSFANLRSRQVLGNTFPFVVFTTFGGFWVSYAILNDPMIAIAAAYSTTGNATEGAASPAFADGIAFYFVMWGILVFIYMLGSLRTNVTFVILFLTLSTAFFLLAAGYFRIGNGHDPTTLLKAGGACAFVTTLCGWWIMLALTLGSTGMPVPIPLGDLSGFLAKKDI